MIGRARRDGKARGTVVSSRSVEQMAGTSLEGWRMRRRSARARLRPPRVVIDGDGDVAAEVARRLGEPGLAGLPSDLSTPADVVVICGTRRPREAVAARVRDVALRAARACPVVALVIADAEALPLCREAARASGLPPWLILAPGGMPLAAAISRRIADQLRVAVQQVRVPVVGGEEVGPHAGLAVVSRYVSVAGIPLADLVEPRPCVEPAAPGRPPSSLALAAAATSIVRAILSDSRRVLCCTAWVEGSYGLPGGFVSVPVPVGARGAETPLPLRLQVEERALLQRVAAR